MKLAAVLLGVVLAIPSIAGADTLNPPGGPVQVDDPVDAADADLMKADQPVPQPRQAGPRAQNRRQLRQALMQQFDVNGDGRLGPRERMRAIKMLRRLEHQLAKPMMRGGGGVRGQHRRFMRRYDVNGDGVVGPREIPDGAADRLRQLDRNGDGWVTPDELPRTR